MENSGNRQSIRRRVGKHPARNGFPSTVVDRTLLGNIAPAGGAGWFLERAELADDAAAEADGDGVGARPGLQLRQQMADVRLHRLLGQKQPLPDLAVHETVRD